jgi:hypothetical protein
MNLPSSTDEPKAATNTTALVSDDSTIAAWPAEIAIVQEKDTDDADGIPQAGVQKMEAVTTVWTKWHIVAAYGM